MSNDQAAALDPVLRMIERRKPWWPPGRRNGYHGVTYGFILGGLVLAVTGRSVGRFFADEVATPLGLDGYLGLPPERYHQAAPMIGPSQRQALLAVLNPIWLPDALSMISRRSVGYRATFGGTAVSFDDLAGALFIATGDEPARCRDSIEAGWEAETSL